LKKAAKLFATKFACGASVTKSPAGIDEIVVQGDVQDEIYDLILDTWKQVRLKLEEDSCINSKL
jgi:density-regulated protein DRP1